MLSREIQVYIKTTETCNLNCSHCFTSGLNGKKVFFNPKATVDFLSRLHVDFPKTRACRFVFHGGEPMLAPLDLLYEFYETSQGIFDYESYAMQTNLVYSLTEDKRKFMKSVLYKDGFGTSWDYDIRFGSVSAVSKEKQLKLWEENVQILAKEDKHNMTLMVCLTKRLIEEREPIEIINYAYNLGFAHILFERITTDGNAKTNSDIIPSNKQQDEWILRMWDQSVENKTYEYINNMFLSEIAIAIVNKEHTANRCRNCEQSLLTINADGTISGCPNTAPTKQWGNINWPVKESLGSKLRMSNIACEIHRNPECYNCQVRSICNGDCHQLGWEGYICAAPKSLMVKLNREQDYKLYNKFILR